MAAIDRAPDGSTTSRLRSAASRTAAAISASVTVTIAVEMGAQVGERPRAERLRPRPVGDGPRHVARPASGRSRRARSESRASAASSGSTPMTRTAGPERLDGRGDAAREPAAADRHEDDREVGQVLDDLEPDRALARR